MCFIYPKEIKKTNVYRHKRFKSKRYKALEFNLYQLINIAAELSWVPSKRIRWGGKTANIAGFSHEIRKVRNFVHPGVWARERPHLKFTKGVFGVVYEICDVANSWLLHKIEQNLLKKLES